jgi:hypothetical protein
MQQKDKTKKEDNNISGWNELLESRLNISDRNKQKHEMDKLIQFVVLLSEAEKENIKLKGKKYEYK